MPDDGPEFPPWVWILVMLALWIAAALLVRGLLIEA